MIMRSGLMVLCAVLIAGCGTLNTDYGDVQHDSINGIRVLRAAINHLGRSEDRWLLSPRLDDVDLLVHVADQQPLPDSVACTWISDWLNNAEHPRQAVLILRDGNVAPWLCRRWAAEARAAGLNEPATEFERIALRETESETPVVPASALPKKTTAHAHDETTTTPATPEPVTPEIVVPDVCSLVTLDRQPRVTPQHITGLGLTRVPQTMTIAACPTAQPNDTVLISADGRPVVVAIPWGDQARLVIVANATMLLDGALVDPAAREFLAAFACEIRRFHGDQTPLIANVNTLRVRENEPQPLSLLSLLRTQPLAWPVWHLIALLAVWVGAKAYWLGRRESPITHRAARFRRHLVALAQHLRTTATEQPINATSRRSKTSPTSTPSRSTPDRP